MKIPRLITRKKKLRATTARRSLGLPDEMDYEEMSEPNMKLSRALLIVLVLHVVAVAGIVAFNTIKTRQVSSGPPVIANTVAQTTSKSDSVANVPAQHDDAKAGHVVLKPVVKDDRKPERLTKPAEKAGSTSDPAKTYVVAKGDNPVTIAKKLKVSYDDLIALNHIDDPHKLQIGQKLMIPIKVAKAKRAGE